MAQIALTPDASGQAFGRTEDGRKIAQTGSLFLARCDVEKSCFRGSRLDSWGMQSFPVLVITPPASIVVIIPARACHALSIKHPAGDLASKTEALRDTRLREKPRGAGGKTLKGVQPGQGAPE